MIEPEARGDEVYFLPQLWERPQVADYDPAVGSPGNSPQLEATQ